MTETRFPDGWQAIEPGRVLALKRQFRKELAPDHPLAGAEFSPVAVHEAEDSVVVHAPALSPPYYLLHLSWADAPPRAPHGLSDPGELAEIFDPPGDSIDEISLWCDAASETGLVFVQHLVNGKQVIDALDWPGGRPPGSTAELVAAGWRHITGPLRPRAQLEGAWVHTGQVVEYWLRPVIDDFFLLRAIESPGEAISLRQLIPPDDRIILCEDRAALAAQLPRGFYCRARSPMAPGYGLSGFPADALPEGRGG
ncbi:MAG: hypothetical protein R3D84_09090 [Paracoccaceae bacterium]